MSKHYLYALSVGKELVYIGCSVYPKRRLDDARRLARKKGLAFDALCQSVLAYSTDKNTALALERALIKRLNPLWNRQGCKFIARRHGSSRQVYLLTPAAESGSIRTDSLVCESNVQRDR